MNKFKTLTAIAVSALLFTACEKEAGISPGNNISASKNAINNDNKSGSLSEQDIVDFTTDLLSDVEPGAAYNLATSLKLLETAVNFDIGNLGQKSFYSERLEIEFEIDYTESGGVYNLDGTYLDYFFSIKNQINDEFLASSFYSTHGSSAFISVIDFEDLDSYGESPVDHITILVDMKYNFEPAVPFCSFENDWKAYGNFGDCAGIYTGDAAKRLESMLTNSSCNSQFGSPGFPCICDVYLYDIKTRFEVGSNDSRIWSGSSALDCITQGDLNTIYEPGAKAVANDLTPTWNNPINPSNPLKGQINYWIRGQNGTSGGSSNHILVVQYAQFIQRYI